MVTFIAIFLVSLDYVIIRFRISNTIMESILCQQQQKIAHFEILNEKLDLFVVDHLKTPRNKLSSHTHTHTHKKKVNTKLIHHQEYKTLFVISGYLIVAFYLFK